MGEEEMKENKMAKLGIGKAVPLTWLHIACPCGKEYLFYDKNDLRIFTIKNNRIVEEVHFKGDK